MAYAHQQISAQFRMESREMTVRKVFETPMIMCVRFAVRREMLYHKNKHASGLQLEAGETQNRANQSKPACAPYYKAVRLEGEGRVLIEGEQTSSQHAWEGSDVGGLLSWRGISLLNLSRSPDFLKI